MKCTRQVTIAALTLRRIGREPSPVRMRSDSTPRRIQSLCGTRRVAAKGSRSEPSKPPSGSQARKVFTSSAISSLEGNGSPRLRLGLWRSRMTKPNGYSPRRRERGDIFGRHYMFTGCGTAMVTPFRSNGSLDEATLRKLVRRQIEQGIDFLVPCGTTGESPTLTREEHLRVVAITVEESAGKVPVLAGAGGNNTHEVVELARECQKLGADGILSVTPYYNKATQEGLYQHYKAIAAAIQIRIILYSVQGRTGVNIEPSTVVRLAEIENIIGIKEASGNITQIAEVI